MTPTIALELEYGETDSDALKANGDKFNGWDFEQNHTQVTLLSVQKPLVATLTAHQTICVNRCRSIKTSMAFDNGRKKTSKDTIGNFRSWFTTVSMTH